MGFLSNVGAFLTNGITIAVTMAALGIAAGLLIFVYVFPGQPKIGVIDIPFTVINENTAYVIGEYLNYAREDDSIKAVVIKLTSPGGGAASSERLYQETRRLREEKPVVLVMNGLVASGGYMMSMGVTHSYAQTSSLVGNVGVITFNDPLVPPNPSESVLDSGPYKISGFTREEWISTLEELKEMFAQLVASERGDKMRISKDELAEGRIYSGLRAVQLGLVDELGSNADAMGKASELAGISNYALVDVNLEVLKEFFQELEDILPSGEAAGTATDVLSLLEEQRAGSGSEGYPAGGAAVTNMERLESMRGLVLYGRLGFEQDDPLPELPMELNHPNFYYLYVGNAE